ncbi:MAG: FtsW/RodA/SpoVE family cell cycle protein, partial [Treponema sp.]|nr:FtsW/RodA/SpoVE family cell cycle protein [Treponema sp.]
MHGLCGALAICGTYFTCHQGFYSGMGWNAFSASLIANSNPLFIIPSSLFMGFITTFSNKYALYHNFGFDMDSLIQALILLLIYTRIFGRYVNGAKSWIGIGEFGIQPSEFGKVFYILFLARYLDESKNEQPLKRFIYAAGILFIPMGLILIQPDLGTASVYLPVFIIMCFIAGIPVVYILYALLLMCFTIMFAVLPVWNAEIAQTPVALISVLTNFKLRVILTVAVLVIMFGGVVIRRYL